MKFPKQLNIIIAEQPSGETTLELEQYSEAQDGEKVAVYVLKEIKTMSIVKTLK